MLRESYFNISNVSIDLIKSFYIVPITIFAIFFLTLIYSSSSVKAASIYDNLVRITPNLEVNDSTLTGCTTVNDNLTNNWPSYILDSSKWYNPTYDTNLNSRYEALRSSFLQALDHGHWAVIQNEATNSVPTTVSKFVTLSWSPSSDRGYIGFGSDAIRIMSSEPEYPNRNFYANIIMTENCEAKQYNPNVNARDYSIIASNEYLPNLGSASIFTSNYPLNIDFSNTYPTGYTGISIPNIDPDNDGDGLSVSQEAQQGTSDENKDNDGDGIDDLKESVWFPDRDDVFCKTSVIPHVCTYPDPTKKDIYVEIDWMNSGTREYKPSSTQLNLVTSMFSAKNINIHFDTGQYGGGEQLPAYTQYLRMTPLFGQLAFKDFKDGGAGITSNFASERNNIWHYMIYGDEYIDNSGDGNLYDTLPSYSTGISEAGGDDLFVSGKVTEDTIGIEGVDLAVASTIAHELGHNLCLSNSQTVLDNLPTGCAYNGIDNYSIKPVNYKSVMNYRYQSTEDYMGSVDYSDGTNGDLLYPDDHDDWSAVMLGMGSFSYNSRTALGSRPSTLTNKTMDKSLIVND